MPITVRDVLCRLEMLAPLALAESYDNVGLLVGDAATPVSTILVALDTSPSVLEQASAARADLIVTHHPLIFSGLKRLVEDGGTISLIRRLMRDGCSLIAMHTNLDSAPRGLNHYVGTLLGLQQMRPLVPSESRPLLKLVVYVPLDHVDAVRAALCVAGAGQIGNYADCTFGTPGTGTFRPGAGTRPYIGTTGALERVEEVRLETVVPRAVLPAVLDAMHAEHPYEEVAYDLFSLENPWPDAGVGRIGTLDAPVPLRDLVARIRTLLHTDRLGVVGDPEQLVTTLALCTGSGGDFVDAARRQRADCYLTGELKHHQALLARQTGLAVIDAGHFATERPAVPLLANYLREALAGVTISEAEERDPLQRW